MKRRDFFRNSSLSIVAGSLISPLGVLAGSTDPQIIKSGSKAKNIIFLVSDGMSSGTLSMASLLLQRKEGRQSHWMQLYIDNKAKRALMDTASADSFVTDSAASSSAWGGGVRVNNGSLNANPDGSFNKPILQKFKEAGKSVGCVTSVPITHATPAGFCINNKSRGDQNDIALQYLPLKFDVMLGGGQDYFDPAKRKDKDDVYKKFDEAGYVTVKTKKELSNLSASETKPLLGVFAANALPFMVDHQSDATLREQIPTLAEMTKAAINKLKNNKKGFVMQVEGGKVDWAAHSNDSAGLLYDQIAFDEAIKVAMDFAEQDKETLIIITTDHGNANPGLFSGSMTEKNFDYMHHFKHSNDWVLNGIRRDSTVSQVIERLEEAQGYAIKKAEAEMILKHYADLHGEGLYNPKKLPFKELGALQTAYTSIGWAGMDHSGDFVELAMFGPGSEWLKPFIKNTDLHNFMLDVTEVRSRS